MYHLKIKKQWILRIVRILAERYHLQVMTKIARFRRSYPCLTSVHLHRTEDYSLPLAKEIKVKFLEVELLCTDVLDIVVAYLDFAIKKLVKFHPKERWM